MAIEILSMEDWLEAHTYLAYSLTGRSKRELEDIYDTYRTAFNFGSCPSDKAKSTARKSGVKFGCGHELGCKRCWEVAYDWWIEEIADRGFWIVESDKK